MKPYKGKQELATGIRAGVLNLGLLLAKSLRICLTPKHELLSPIAGGGAACTLAWTSTLPCSAVLGYFETQPWKARAPFLLFSWLSEEQPSYRSRDPCLLSIFIENETRQSVQNIICEICSTSRLTKYVMSLDLNFK